ncbi:MAG: hypothetical protein JNM06_20935, partial [Blastocatellia bacterium]|nr:hypothetical protein [Blastocatellia bacterium]
AFTHTQLAFFGTKSVRITLTCNNAYVDSLSLRALLGATTFPSTVVTGSVLEGTNPINDRLYLQWSKVSGPGNAIFSTPTDLTQ